MKPRLVLPALCVTAIFLASALHEPRTLEASAVHLLAESARLRAHFDAVDIELRTRDIAQLSSAQRLARAELISWLQEYRDEGMFPRNDRFRDRAMPFFRDSHGTLCAMAYLIDRSGRGDIVEDVAAARNNAFIVELVDDARLVAWLDSVGLSAAEAARIQPMYEWDPHSVVEENDVSTGYAWTTVSLGTASLVTGLVNLYRPTRASGFLGMVAGSAALVAGATRLERSGETRQYAFASTAVGTLAVVTAINTLRARPSVPPASGAGSRSIAGLNDLTITPDVGWPGGAARAGVRLGARF